MTSEPNLISAPAQLLPGRGNWSWFRASMRSKIGFAWQLESCEDQLGSCVCIYRCACEGVGHVDPPGGTKEQARAWLGQTLVLWMKKILRTSNRKSLYMFQWYNTTPAEGTVYLTHMLHKSLTFSICMNAIRIPTRSPSRNNKRIVLFRLTNLNSGF